MGSGAAHVGHHAVQFYGSEQILFSSVAGFLGQGLVDGQPAVVIATADHAAGIREHLRNRFVDVAEAEKGGDLLILDAHRTLAQFMIGDMPDADAFESSVGRLVGELARRRAQPTFIRAYGEMVDVLWKAGRCDAAIKLEMLWNRLAARYSFALLCGYAMDNFATHTDLFEEVCRQHTHVMPTRTPIAAPPGDRRIQ
jgi:hypothetical protein